MRIAAITKTDGYRELEIAEIAELGRLNAEFNSKLKGLFYPDTEPE